LLRPRFKRVLVLGLGGGGVPAFFQTRKEFTDIEVVAVDISAAVARAATACFDLEASSNINVKVDDAEAYLRREVRGDNERGMGGRHREGERDVHTEETTVVHVCCVCVCVCVCAGTPCLIIAESSPPPPLPLPPSFSLQTVTGT
jgi:hypothetical protein